MTNSKIGKLGFVDCQQLCSFSQLELLQFVLNWLKSAHHHDHDHVVCLWLVKFLLFWFKWVECFVYQWYPMSDVYQIPKCSHPQTLLVIGKLFIYISG